MKIIKKIYGKVEFLLYYYISIFRIIILSKTKKKRIYLMGIPVHGNLGDQAIVIAERKFLEDNFNTYKIIEVESSLVTNHIKLLKKVVGDSLILIHGGGFIGTIWPKEDNMAKLIIKNFNSNSIIMLPQTAFFDNNDDGKKLIKQNKEIYENNKNLYICVREKYSYDFMKENFEKCNIYLIPDMVLYMKPTQNNNTESDLITICLRNDREKTFSNINLLVKKINEKGYNNYTITDTVIDRRLYTYNRIKMVNKKIRDFANSKVVITDRLHGMVFAYLANTPCVVINSKSYKVRGVYNWIKDDNKIKIIDNIDEFDNVFDEIIKQKSYFDTENLKNKYNDLSDLIKDNLYKNK